jgi:hypothetical protein
MGGKSFAPGVSWPQRGRDKRLNYGISGVWNDGVCDSQSRQNRPILAFAASNVHDAGDTNQQLPAAACSQI